MKRKPMKRKCELCGKPYKAALFGWIKNCECKESKNDEN